MGRNLNKDSESPAASIPERRSLRNSKPVEEEVKSKAAVKGKKVLGKAKREEKITKKSDEKLDKKTEDESCDEPAGDEKNKSNSDADGEMQSTKPAARRSGRKRQLSEDTELEEEEEDAGKEDNKNDDQIDDGSKDETKDEDMEENKDENNEEEKDKSRDDKEENASKETSVLKNGQEGGTSKGKAKKKRKPPTKKKKEEPDESEMWTPLEPLDGEGKKESQKRTQAKSDRRKQALVERQAPAEPMLQKQIPRQRRNSDTSECEVLGSVPRTQRRPKTIVTVDIDDEASETGSIQIVAEPDVSYVFDFKRLLIQYRNVNLPSPLWGAHKDPRNNFISFTRFNPDYPDINGLIVDRAVVFNGSLNHEIYVNGEKVEPPADFNAAAETLLEVAQIIEFVNNTISPPLSQEPNELADISCSG